MGERVSDRMMLCSGWSSIEDLIRSGSSYSAPATLHLKAEKCLADHSFASFHEHLRTLLAWCFTNRSQWLGKLDEVGVGRLLGED
eukprot:3368337-Pleurochrysis_carterae.AAC.3